MLARKPRRRGGQLVEAAIVMPVLVIMLVGMIIGAAGVFANSQVAMLAREGARWASVHGPTYASENSQPQATAATVLSQGILPMAGGLDPSNFQPAPTLAFNSTSTTVTVKVSYQWNPLLYFPPVTLTSTAQQNVTY